LEFTLPTSDILRDYSFDRTGYDESLKVFIRLSSDSRMSPASNKYRSFHSQRRDRFNARTRTFRILWIDSSCVFHSPVNISAKTLDLVTSSGYLRVCHIIMANRNLPRNWKLSFQSHLESLPASEGCEPPHIRCNIHGDLQTCSNNGPNYFQITMESSLEWIN